MQALRSELAARMAIILPAPPLLQLLPPPMRVGAAWLANSVAMMLRVAPGAYCTTFCGTPLWATPLTNQGLSSKIDFA